MQHSRIPKDSRLLPSHEELFSIIESLHDNVAIVDCTGVMRWISPSFEETYSVRHEDIIGRTTYELEAEQIFYPSVAALVLKTHNPVTLAEKTRSGGNNIITGIPIFDDSGNIAFIVSYSVDFLSSRLLHEEHEKINQLIVNPQEQDKPPSEGSSINQAMRRLLETVEKVARVDTTLLITGESGVGKNVLARMVHHLSKRSGGPLVEINCAGIPASLLESELFGYEAGAFTGASAQGKEGRIALSDGGTLFLDEIGELPLRLQAKLLQAIQEKQIVKIGGIKPVHIDFRLITATNQNLEALVEKKRFREDLFFRLNVLPLHIPPLRERREDIPSLCRSILKEMNTKYEIGKMLSSETQTYLTAYSWPGNIRELRNVIERIVVVSETGTIEPWELPEHIRAQTSVFKENMHLHDALENLERNIILDAYKKYGTTTGVAKALGISQPTAARKIARYRNETVRQ